MAKRQASAVQLESVSDRLDLLAGRVDQLTEAFESALSRLSRQVDFLGGEIARVRDHADDEIARLRREVR